MKVENKIKKIVAKHFTSNTILTDELINEVSKQLFKSKK